MFLILTIAPIDQHIQRDGMMASMLSQIDTLSNPQAGTKEFEVGFSKVNLTPPFRTATAGYGKRLGKDYSAVHDSIYVRTMVIDNGAERVALVSLDLLLIPPEVTALLEVELPAIGFSLDNTYLGAIHSHNSIGNWGKGALTIMYGRYDDRVVHHIADRIKESIQRANSRKSPASIKSGEIPVSHAVYNRLIDNGPVDSLLRVLVITRNDSSRLVLMNFTAHATCLYSKDLELSRDYPGRLVDNMESHGYAFAMFMAGAVGSQGPRVAAQGWPCVDEMGMTLSSAFASNRSRLQPVGGNTLWMKRVQLLMSEPQVKFLRHWRLRPWLFNAVFGDYPETLTVLRLGDLVMIGAPCDFSAEFYPAIDSVAHANGLRAMITSFNGGYAGYVTPSRYYDEDHYETQLMNWYGPGNAEYMEKCMKQLVIQAAGN